jgi:hypothetical protein
LPRPTGTRSQALHWQYENIADSTLGLNDAWCARVRLQLSPQPQDLHVYAAIKHVFVNARRLQKMFAAQRSLRRVEECDQ